jgi:hypothetical protein
LAAPETIPAPVILFTAALERILGDPVERLFAAAPERVVRDPVERLFAAAARIHVALPMVPLTWWRLFRTRSACGCARVGET